MFFFNLIEILRQGFTSWSEIYCVDQIDLELTEIGLFLLCCYWPGPKIISNACSPASQTRWAPTHM